MSVSADLHINYMTIAVNTQNHVGNTRQQRAGFTLTYTDIAKGFFGAQNKLQTIRQRAPTDGLGNKICGAGFIGVMNGFYIAQPGDHGDR